MVFLNEDKIRISYKKEGKMLFSQQLLVNLMELNSRGV